MATSGSERFHHGQGGFAVVRDQRAVPDRAQNLSDGICEGAIVFDD